MRPVSPPLGRDMAGSGQDSADSRVQLIFLLGALSAFGPLSLDMYLPSLPALAQDLNGTASQVQLTLTACLLGLGGGQILVGPLSDALGRRRPLLAGLFAYMAASFLCALAPSVPILIGLRLVQGAAGAAGIVIARAAVRDLYAGAALARFFALTMAVNGLAPILAPILGAQLLHFTSWRGVFVVLGAIGLVLLLAAVLGFPETLPPARRRSGGVRMTLTTFGQLLRDRVFVGYALSSGLALGAMFAYIAGSPFVLEDIYGVSPQGFSLVFATNALGIILASQSSARLIRRVPARRLLAAGFGGSLAGALLLFGAVTANVGLIGVLPGFFLVVASIGLIAPNAVALALAEQGARAGSASAFLGVLQYVFGAVVAPLVGLGGTQTAGPMAALIAGLSAAACLAFLLLTRGAAGSPPQPALDRPSI